MQATAVDHSWSLQGTDGEIGEDQGLDQNHDRDHMSDQGRRGGGGGAVPPLCWVQLVVLMASLHRRSSSYSRSRSRSRSSDRAASSARKTRSDRYDTIGQRWLVIYPSSLPNAGTLPGKEIPVVQEEKGGVARGMEVEHREQGRRRPHQG